MLHPLFTHFFRSPQPKHIRALDFPLQTALRKRRCAHQQCSTLGGMDPQLIFVLFLFSVQLSSVAQLCPTLCNPLDCSRPGLPVHHKLPEFTQTHVHRVGDAIQPSHPVVLFSSRLQSFPASGFFPMSQFFTSGGQSIGVSASASVFPRNNQD